MSAEVGVVGGGILSVLGAVATATAGAVMVAGTVALSGIAVGAGALVATGASLYQVGKNVVDASQILLEERQVVRDISLKFKDYLSKSKNIDSLQAVLDNINSFFTKYSLILSKDYFLKQMNHAKSIEEKIKIGYRLIELECKYSILKDHCYTLLDLNKGLNEDFSEIVRDFNNLYLVNPDDLEEQINIQLKNIKDKFAYLKERHEIQLKGKTFDNEFIDVEETKERLMLSAFSSELNNMFQNSNDEEVIKLINQSMALSTLKRIYNICAILSKDSAFQNVSGRVLNLWSKAIKLSNRDDISCEDYKYEINLIISSLDLIEQELKCGNKNLYDEQKKFNDLLLINNKYRKLLHYSIIEKPFNPDTYEKDAKKIEMENSKLEAEFKKTFISQSLTQKLVKNYTKENYSFVLTSEPKKIKNHIILKTYLLTPDCKNVLCLSVNELGTILGEVVGVKIPGLVEDAASIFGAQKVFCSHTKKVLENIFAGYGMEMPETLVEPPSITKTIRSKDFSNILPQRVIDNVKELCLMKTREETRKRAI